MTSINHPQLTQLAADLTRFWAGHGYQVILGALAAVFCGLAVSLYVAKRSGHVERWLSVLAAVAVLGLQSEGMWVVARERLHLPAVLAVCVFFLAEAAMVSSAAHARKAYRRTTERAPALPDGSPGPVTKAGHPGKHGRNVWLIAAGAGVIVALNAHSLVEALLRLGLPLLAAGLWWAELTDEGTSTPAGTFRWTPRRLLIRLGAITGEQEDLSAVERERRVRAMTVTARRLHRGGKLAGLHEGRLQRLALSADSGTVAEVQRRVRQAHRIKELTDPSGTGGRVDGQPDGVPSEEASVLPFPVDGRVDGRVDGSAEGWTDGPRDGTDGRVDGSGTGAGRTGGRVAAAVPADGVRPSRASRPVASAGPRRREPSPEEVDRALADLEAGELESLAADALRERYSIHRQKAAGLSRILKAHGSGSNGHGQI